MTSLGRVQFVIALLVRFAASLKIILYVFSRTSKP